MTGGSMSAVKFVSLQSAVTVWLLSMLAAANLGCIAFASETVTPEPDGLSYHFVSHYNVKIDAPVVRVWAQLVDLPSWMYEFDLALESGNARQEGEVRRLYTGQEFFIQTIKVIPNALLVFANLPSTFNEEHSSGVAVIALTEIDAVTDVNLTMSRRYSWGGTGTNPNKSTRESAEFQERTRAMWQDRFLGRLKSIVEAQ